MFYKMRHAFLASRMGVPSHSIADTYMFDPKCAHPIRMLTEPGRKVPDKNGQSRYSSTVILVLTTHVDSLFHMVATTAPLLLASCLSF